MAAPPRGLGTGPSSRDEPTPPHRQQACQGPGGRPAALAGRAASPEQRGQGAGARPSLPSASAGSWAGWGGGCRRAGPVQEPPRSATAKAWVRTKNKFGEGRERDGKQTQMSWGSAELKAWTQEDTSPSLLRPAQPHVGIGGIPTMPDPPPARWALPLLAQSSATVLRRGPTACRRCRGVVRQLGAPACLLLQQQGLPLRQQVSAFHNSG